MEREIKELLPPFDPPPYPVRGFHAGDLISRCSCRRDSSSLAAPTKNMNKNKNKNKNKKKLKLKLKYKRPTSVSCGNNDDENKRSSPPELTSIPMTVGVSDSMGSSKVCPVCKTFASSSNTTLNAHIDRCLSEDTAAASSAVDRQVSIGGGIVSKPIGRRRLNPPCKKRSMVEIYASSSCCTLEDLDRRNGTTWALDLGSVPAGQILSATEDTLSKTEMKYPVVDDENDGTSAAAAAYIDSNGTKVCILSKLNSSKSLDIAGDDSGVHRHRKHSNPPPPVVKIKKKNTNKDGGITKIRRNFRYMHSDPSKKLNDKPVHYTGETCRRKLCKNLPSSSAKTVRSPLKEEKENPKTGFLFESCFVSKKKVRSQRSSMKKKKVSDPIIILPDEKTTTEEYHVVPDVPSTPLDNNDYTETAAVDEQPSVEEEDPVVSPPYENGDNKKLISGTEAWVELFASSIPEPTADNRDEKISPNIETTSGGGDIQYGESRFRTSSRVVSCVEILHQPRKRERDRDREEAVSGSPVSSTISHPSTCSKDHKDSDVEIIVGKSQPRPRSIPPSCYCSHVSEASHNSAPILRLMGKDLMVVNNEDEHHHQHHHLQQQQQQQQRLPETPSPMSFTEFDEQYQQQQYYNIDPYRRSVGYHHQHHNHNHHIHSLNGGRSSGADGFRSPYLQISGNRRYFPPNHPPPNMLPVPQDPITRTQKRSYTPHQNLFYNNSHRLPGSDGVGVTVRSPASPMSMMTPIYHPFQPREVSNYGAGNIVNIPMYQYHHHNHHPSESTAANRYHRGLHHLTPPAYFNSPPSLRH